MKVIFQNLIRFCFTDQNQPKTTTVKTAIAKTPNPDEPNPPIKTKKLGSTLSLKSVQSGFDFAKGDSDLSEEEKIALLGKPKLGTNTRTQIRIKENKEYKVSHY